MPALSFLFFTSLVSAQEVHEPSFTKPNWTQSFEPFRIAGNLYYVGTAELGCYLLTTPAGNILINTGIGSSRELLQQNIEKLGFKLADVKILLTTQVHYDHVGAIAEIKKLTGAQLMVDEADAAVLEDGGNSDYEYGGHGWLFQPAKADRLLHNNDTISLGGTQLVMLHHPGHTKGSCSFMVTVKDEQQSYRVLIANMPTIITDRTLNDVPTYPEILKDYAYTLRAMKGLTFDLWVASHASQFNLAEKHKPGDTYNPSAFAGRSDYDEELDELAKDYTTKRQ
ncbi:subclass B3 metallo-beta-lactamase [Deminuibacter soli]